MKDEEDIGSYMLIVNEVVNSIRGLGKEIEDKVIVKNILRSLTSRFDTKISAIEEVKDLNSFTLVEMRGSFISYKIRIGKAKIDDKEDILKAIKSSKSNTYVNEDEASYMEESNFVRKLKREQG